jgi:DNA-binding transcriptional ArsR family regulator
MKEIKRLRSYLKFLAEGTKNHGKAAELLDDLDTIEAYIDALEIHQNDQQPYRELAAKILLSITSFTHHYRILQIGRLSLTAMALEKAQRWI